MFVRTGMLCFCVAFLLGTFCIGQSPQTQTQTQDEPPPSTDIYLLSWPAKAEPSDLRNVTNREGYDNQPMFSPDGDKVYFTSIGGDDQADIYAYSIKNGDTKRITETLESEYSPTFMPDGKHLSVVRVEKDKDNTQRLWKFPLNGGPPSLVLENIKPVGYHCWIDGNSVALFILGEPNTLQIADISTGKAEKIADNIGRSMHKIPGTSKISFTVKQNDRWILQEFDPQTHKIETIVEGADSSEDYVWTRDGKILMASGTILFQWDPSHPVNNWTQVADLSNTGFGKITRLALHPQGSLLALVAQASRRH